MEGRSPEIPQPKSVEVRYAGFKTPIREVNSTTDTPRINEINKALLEREWDEVGPESIDDTAAWLRSATSRKFSSLRPETPKHKVVGVEPAKRKVALETQIAVVTDPSGLAAYTYIYDHESPVVNGLQGTGYAESRKEISYVTDQPDSKRKPEAMAEALQQTAMMLWELQAGKDVRELSGTFSLKEFAQAKRLEIFTTAGNGADETNYRKGLELAGFKKLGSYDEEGALQHVYRLDCGELMTTFARKKAPTQAA